MELSEILGYVGLAFIAVSFFFTNIRILRLLNLVGAIAMAFYGFMIDSLPVAILNIIIAVVNIYYLNKLYTTVSRFDLLEVKFKPRDAFDKFYQAHNQDIQAFFPELEMSQLVDSNVALIMRDFKIVGAFVYKIVGATVFVYMDYVVPDARDSMNSEYLEAVKYPEFRAQGAVCIEARTTVDKHSSHLLAIGYKQQPDQKTYRYDLQK